MKTKQLGPKGPTHLPPISKKKGFTVHKVLVEPTIISFLQCCFILLKNRNSYFYYTIGPFILSIPFILIAFFLKINLVSDIRDPLYINLLSNYGNTTKNTLFKSLIKTPTSFILEWLILLTSQKIILCTPGMISYYRYYFPCFSRKFVLITNGHSLPPPSPSTHKGKKTNITQVICLGKFFQYGEQKSTQTLERMEEYLQNWKISDFQVHIYGEDRERFNQYLELYPRFNYVIIHNRVPLRSIPTLLSNYDFAIQIIRNESYDLGTKFFDYLAIGIPIVDTLSKNSNASLFMQECIRSASKTNPFKFYSREGVLNRSKPELLFSLPIKQ